MTNKNKTKYRIDPYHSEVHRDDSQLLTDFLTVPAERAVHFKLPLYLSNVSVYPVAV